MNDLKSNMFDWSGDDSRMARTMAAYKLVDEIIDNRVKGEPINIVAHSHGGNVAIEAANILFEKYETQVDNLIIIGTPSRDDYRLIEGAVVGEFLNIYTNDDVIQINGGAGKLWAFNLVP